MSTTQKKNDDNAFLDPLVSSVISRVISEIALLERFEDRVLCLERICLHWPEELEQIGRSQTRQELEMDVDDMGFTIFKEDEEKKE